jgi:hypothetical protein
MDTINQILEQAQKTPEYLLQYKDNKYLRNFLEAALLPEKKFNLPEGSPPYKENQQHEEQLRGSFWQIAKKLDIFQRTDLKPFRQELLFVQALESLPESEAKLLLAAKDQTLHKVYKGLTLKKLTEIGYF